MLERLNNILRDRKEGDKGFSLVELAVVIVILGVLVAIAVPIFANLQGTAQTNTLKAAAANGASMVAVDIASEAATIGGDLSKLAEGDISSVAITVPADAADATLTDFCVTATGFGGKTQTSGPTCP